MPTFPLRPIAASLLIWCLVPAYAQTTPETADVADPRLAPPCIIRGSVSLKADFVEGDRQQMRAEGDVVLEKDAIRMQADRLIYQPDKDTATAEGHVRLEKNGDVLLGKGLELNMKTETGYLTEPEFFLGKRPDRVLPARGTASRFELVSKDKDRLENGRYTTCGPDDNSWYLRVKELELDRATQIGVAKNATVMFKETPILYMPWLDFPLNNQRKSGLLPPAFGTSVSGGFEYTQPWYWNIAPNMDATITPKIFTKRGLQAGSEFRYLEPSFGGLAAAEFLPNDRGSNGDNRVLLALTHEQKISSNWTGGINLQKVSDDDYFRDLSTRISATSQTYLPREATLNYADDNWTFGARVLHYQTLRDPKAPELTPIPYQLQPQLSLRGYKQNVFGADLALESDFAQYQHPTLVSGRRLTLYPSISFPMTQPYGFITPRFGWRAIQYQLTDNAPGFDSGSINAPVGSLDTGLFYERDMQIANRNYRQTLEPRAYYAYVPFRKQNQFPNFSSSETDFNFAQIFSDNQFVGGDRIEDANQLTVAMTSRLIDPATGLERLRGVIAQRFYFDAQQVSLNQQPRTSKASDVLASLGGQISDRWSLNSVLQFKTDQGRTEKLLFAARYLPQPGKVINLAYRFSSNPLTPEKQIDLSAQWPLSDKWYGLARYNYSLRDSRLLDGLVGLEYNAACWKARIVAHRFTTGQDRYSTPLFAQLELTGLSSIGINPFETLKQNISGYAKSTEINQ
jgi:LPS-assembly protein